MNIKELREYLSELPEEVDSWGVFIATNVGEITDDGEYWDVEHKPVFTVMGNKDTKELVFFDEENIKKFDERVEESK